MTDPDAAPPRSGRSTGTRPSGGAGAGGGGGLGRATTVITFWNLVSRITGLVRLLATTAALGVTVLGDVYQRTNLVSNVLFELLAGGMLFSVLVPSFVQGLRSDDSRGVRRLAGALAVRGSVVLGGLSILGIIFGEPIIAALSSGASPDTRDDQVALGTFLLIFILPQLVLYLIGAVSSALLQADHRFAATSLAPVLNNVVLTITMVAFAAMHDPSDGLHLDMTEKLLLGGGTLFGTVAMTVVPLLALRRGGLGLLPAWKVEGGGLGALARRGMWGAGHVGLNQVLIMSTAYFAGWVEGGVIAYQSAFTFFLLPHALLAHPIFTALYPRLSRQGADGDRGAFAADLGRGLRSIIFLVLPAAGLVGVASLPGLTAIQVGQFDGEGARLVALVLAAFLTGIAGYSTFFLLTRASYALEDPVTPTVVNLVVTATTVIAMWSATLFWDGTGLLIAFGLITSAISVAGSVALHRLLVRALGRPVPVVGTVLRTASAAIPATAAAAGAAALIGWDGRAQALGATVASMAVGAIVHVTVLDLMSAPELAAWGRTFRRVVRPVRRLLGGGRGTRLLQVSLLIVIPVMVGGSLLVSRARAPQTIEVPPAARKVVIVTVPGLTVDDVDGGVMSELDRLASIGSIAVANVRTASDAPDVVGSYASLGAGNRTAGSTELPVLFDLDRSVADGTTIADLIETLTGVAPEGEFAIANFGVIAAATAPTGGSEAGSLGDAAARAGLTVGIVASGDPSAPEGGGVIVPAALAAARSDGSISTGVIGPIDLLTTIPGHEAGATIEVTDVGPFASAVRDVHERADIVFVDPGEMARATARIQMDESLRDLREQMERDEADGDAAEGAPPASHAEIDGDPVDEEDLPDHRAEALQRTDEVIAAVRKNLLPGTVLLVAGLADDGDRWPLTPVVAVGAGVPHGYLDSASTHRPGLVTLTDLAPTILESAGAPIPGDMIGQPLRFRETDSSWGEAKELDELVANRASADKTMTVVFGAAYGLLIAIMAARMLGWRGGHPRIRTGIEMYALTCAAWPASTYLVRIGTSLYSKGPASLILTWSIAAVMAVVASRLRGHRLDPLLAVASLTVGVIVGDLLTGAHLQVGSFFGYMPHTAPRFIGLGNAGFAILTGATIAVIGASMARSRNRDLAWWWCVGIAVVVVIVDGAPWLGTDVGGMIALVPVLALLLWALRGHRLGPATLVAAAAALVVVLAVAVGIEALRSPEDRTHLGRFFLSAGEGTNFFDTIRRKWDLNTASLRDRPILWSLPIGVAVGTFLGRRSTEVARVLPHGSPERMAVGATIAAGTLGWLANDSGISVLALSCAFLAPFLVLLLGDDSPPNDAADAPVTEEHATAELPLESR